MLKPQTKRQIFYYDMFNITYLLSDLWAARFTL